MSDLKVDMVELASELGVSDRTVRRWLDDGVDSPAEVAIRGFLRFEILGLAWKRGSVTVRLGMYGVEFWPDEEVAASLRPERT